VYHYSAILNIVRIKQFVCDTVHPKNMIKSFYIDYVKEKGDHTVATYDKPKRKNTPLSQISVWNMISSLVSGLVYYGLIVPTRWIWRQSTRLMQWSWHQTIRLVSWMWRQTGNILSWSWRVIYMILRNTVFVPFIFVGRLLGFVANPVPEGLSAEETEAYQRINRQFRRQKRWYLHILAFLVGMAALWVPEFINTYYSRMDFVVTFTVIWLIMLGGHRLWMNLGDSEDREIGNALDQIRRSQQTVYFEEEIYDDPAYYDSSRLEETEYDDNVEWIEDEIPPMYKTKRQGN